MTEKITGMTEKIAEMTETITGMTKEICGFDKSNLTNQPPHPNPLPPGEREKNIDRRDTCPAWDCHVASLLAMTEKENVVRNDRGKYSSQ